MWNRRLKRLWEWEKVHFADGDVAACMDQQIQEFLSAMKENQ